MLTEQITRVTDVRLVNVGAGAGARTARLWMGWSAARHPWEVRLTFVVRSGATLRWTVGRDLLRDGLTSKRGAGVGAVNIGPGRWPSEVWMALHSPGVGSLLVFAVREPVEQVLRFAYGTVSEGEELSRVDIDGALAAMVAEGGER